MRVLITTVLLVPLAACASPTAFDRGLANLRAGRYAEAKAAFDEALQASAAALANRGVARARLGDLDGAIDDYTRALDLAPGDGDILFDRGNAWAAKGEYQRAMADFRRAAETDPRRAQALFRNAAIELQREPSVTAAPRPLPREPRLRARRGPPPRSQRRRRRRLRCPLPTRCLRNLSLRALRRPKPRRRRRHQPRHPEPQSHRRHRWRPWPWCLRPGRSSTPARSGAAL